MEQVDCLQDNCHHKQSGLSGEGNGSLDWVAKEMEVWTEWRRKWKRIYCLHRLETKPRMTFLFNSLLIKLNRTMLMCQFGGYCETFQILFHKAMRNLLVMRQTIFLTANLLILDFVIWFLKFILHCWMDQSPRNLNLLLKLKTVARNIFSASLKSAKHCLMMWPTCMKNNIKI